MPAHEATAARCRLRGAWHRSICFFSFSARPRAFIAQPPESAPRLRLAKAATLRRAPPLTRHSTRHYTRHHTRHFIRHGALPHPQQQLTQTPTQTNANNPARLALNTTSTPARQPPQGPRPPRARAPCIACPLAIAKQNAHAWACLRARAARCARLCSPPLRRATRFGSPF